MRTAAGKLLLTSVVMAVLAAACTSSTSDETTTTAVATTAAPAPTTTTEPLRDPADQLNLVLMWHQHQPRYPELDGVDLGVEWGYQDYDNDRSYGGGFNYVHQWEQETVKNDFYDPEDPSTGSPFYTEYTLVENKGMEGLLDLTFGNFHGFGPDDFQPTVCERLKFVLRKRDQPIGEILRSNRRIDQGRSRLDVRTLRFGGLRH